MVPVSSAARECGPRAVGRDEQHPPTWGGTESRVDDGKNQVAQVRDGYRLRGAAGAEQRPVGRPRVKPAEGVLDLGQDGVWISDGVKRGDVGLVCAGGSNVSNWLWSIDGPMKWCGRWARRAAVSARLSSRSMKTTSPASRRASRYDRRRAEHATTTRCSLRIARRNAASHGQRSASSRGVPPPCARCWRSCGNRQRRGTLRGATPPVATRWSTSRPRRLP